MKIVEKEKIEFSPDIIFTHHSGDLNIDHRLTFQAVITATRPMEKEKVKTIVTFETSSGTEWQASNDPDKFSPNMYVEVMKADIDAKIKGMESYEFERRECPHSRSPEVLEILSRMRGVQVVVNYVEAF